MKRLLFLCLLFPSMAFAQMPLEQVKPILEQYTIGDWLAFREFDGRQLVYFTHIQGYHCSLEAISYSINSDALDQSLEVAKCYEDSPYMLDDNAQIYISLGSGEAKTVSVRVTYKDGTQSPIMRFQPCDVPPGATCGKRAE